MNIPAKVLEEDILQEETIKYKFRKQYFLFGRNVVVVTGFGYHGFWKIVSDYENGDVLNGDDGEGHLIPTNKVNPDLKENN